MKGAVQPPPFQSDDARRLAVVARGHCGLDYIDVRGDGRTLVVAFFGPLPRLLGREHFAIDGGKRVTGLHVSAMRVVADEPEAEGVVTLLLDRPGDASVYTLRVAGVPGVDPLYAALSFTFDLGDERLTDCTADAPPALPFAAPPHIDYLAKDYATFRRLLLDRATLVMPEWSERHIPDLNVTLIELLAYAGDQLSYFQDAVATEAYLATARKRVSVRRHARLLDYRMHDGCNARVWISLTANVDAGPIDPRALVFSTTATASTPAEYFEPIGEAPLHAYAAHGPMALYAWGNRTCALAAGATAATLRDAWEPATAGAEPLRALRHLETGAYVMFEAVRDVVDGAVVAADSALRHVVRLTHVRREIDPLFDVPIVEIAWAPADRLPFALELAAANPKDAAGPPLELSVAWGNVVAADHGRSLDAAEALADVPTEPQARYRPALAQANLTFSERHRPGSAASLNVRDPQSARPQIFELVTTDVGKHERRWSPRPDLLESGPNDARYVVEVDDDGAATLRFGDGVLGRRPPPGAAVRARYRVGNGVAGNVGAETIVNVGFRGTTIAGLELRARNPLPACGGAAPEAVDDVRILAPSAFRAQSARAIAPEDYATIAGRDPRLQRAAALLRWTGSRTLVRVALDPLGTEDLDAGTIADVTAALEAVRCIGHDVEVVAATYVPLFVALDVTVKRGYQRGHVLAALEAAFGSALLPDGSRGYFHPDELTFGGTIAQSRIIARALGVTGVEDVSVRRLERLSAPTPQSVPDALTMGPLEIAQLDGDAAQPERGVLTLAVRGGR